VYLYFIFIIINSSIFINTHTHKHTIIMVIRSRWRAFNNITIILDTTAGIPEDNWHGLEIATVDQSELDRIISAKLLNKRRKKEKRINARRLDCYNGALCHRACCGNCIREHCTDAVDNRAYCVKRIFGVTSKVKLICDY
jgi:hypothetical protein